MFDAVVELKERRYYALNSSSCFEGLTNAEVTTMIRFFSISDFIDRLCTLTIKLPVEFLISASNTRFRY
jgi:hypothetical protein